MVIWLPLHLKNPRGLCMSPNRSFITGHGHFRPMTTLYTRHFSQGNDELRKSARFTCYLLLLFSHTIIPNFRKYINKAEHFQMEIARTKFNEMATEEF